MIRFGTSGDGQKQEITISNGTVIRVLLLVLIFMGFVTFLSKITDALLLLIVSFFLALALNSPVHWLARHLPHPKGHEHRAAATVISFLIIVIILGGFAAAISPPIASQTKNFINHIPSYVSDFQNENSGFGKFVKHYHLQPEVNKFSEGVKSHLSSFTGSAVNTIASVARSVVLALTILVLTFLMLVEGPRWLKYGSKLLPSRHEAHVASLAQDMYKVVRGYVNGQVILAAIAAALITPALFILHISYPVALIFVIFLCGLIPFIGHTIGAIIVTLVALFHSPISAAIILAYYILYINIENYVIQPRLQSFTTNMTPLMVFGAVVIGVSFDGIIGGLLAIPVAGCIKVLLLDYIYRKNLIDDTATTGTK
jgi:predicted PurR-regulated permease PerM